MSAQEPLKCPHCLDYFWRVNAFRKHLRRHPKQRSLPPPSPPTKLLSRRSSDVTDGVFDFATILLEDDQDVTFDAQRNVDSDGDSYFSDRDINSDDTSASGEENDDISDIGDDDEYDDDDDYGEEEDDNDDVDGDDDGGDDSDTDADNRNKKRDRNERHFDEYPPEYFIGRTVDDADIPYSDDIFPPIDKTFRHPTSFVTQVRLQDLFSRNKGSLKMYDEVIKIINAYTSASDFSPFDKLLPRKKFISRMEEMFETKNFKPMHCSVKLHNGSFATVPVFDMKAMILSILHDPTLMCEDNFAEGLDIFTGNVDDECEANNYYGEIHTGDAWESAINRFGGENGKYMPLGIVIFGDKSHTDLHGTLSVTPVTFTATFFNRAVRNNPDCWRPIAYLPNLDYGKSGVKSSDKVQNEHNCLALAFKSLIELSEEGGIRTNVMGRNVIVKPFIHYFIGDTEGMNKWLGHYQGTQPGMGRPYRDCHCTFDDLDNPAPQCTYTRASEFRRAMRLVVRNSDAEKSETKRMEAKKSGLQMLKNMSRHCIHNALMQSKLPLSDQVHGANKMCPPESLHVLDAGITMYMQESLQLRISGGTSTNELDRLHGKVFADIRRQSERDFPRGATRSGLVETTRCQSSERKGNFFLLMVIAHTADGKLILRHELQYSQAQYKQWLDLLKLYLAMEEWFHDARFKDEVDRARPVVAAVISKIKKYFPRSEDTYGYKIPKMHALAKMIEYICLFGSAINFYGGPGEASHKEFVKAPGLKTQRRLCEFASQIAEQYYNVMVTNKACKYVDIALAENVLHDDTAHFTNNIEEVEYTVEGKYTVDLYVDNTVHVATKNKHVKKHGLHPSLVKVFRRLGEESDGEGNISDVQKSNHRFSGYTRATVIGTDGEKTSYNAHPYFHGGPWYDWAFVYYEIEEEFGSVSKYYPSKILGFVKDNDDEVHAIIMCSCDPLPWGQLEDNFVAKFKLCSKPGEEQVVPLSSLVHPIGVVPDYGSMDPDDYVLILPKGQWSDYFGRIVERDGES